MSMSLSFEWSKREWKSTFQMKVHWGTKTSLTVLMEPFAITPGPLITISKSFIRVGGACYPQLIFASKASVTINLRGRLSLKKQIEF